MQVKLLGPLELLEEGRPLRIPGEKLRAITAVLALHANRTVPRTELIDELWAEKLPLDAENSLHGHMARLRRIIATGTGETGGEARRALIGTSHSGYSMALPESQVDAISFCQLVVSAEKLRTERPEEAVALLTRALDCWHGPALMDAGSGMICELARTRLTETRLTAQEWLFDAQLALGLHRGIVPRLEQLTVRYPLRERFVEQLMTALCESGRQAEALDVYRRTWHRLSHELGLEPGDALRAKLQQILRPRGAPSVRHG